MVDIALLSDVNLCCAALAQLVAANQLCNSYQAFNTNYHDTGLFGIITTAEKTASFDDLSWAIMNAVSSIFWQSLCAILTCCRSAECALRYYAAAYECQHAAACHFSNAAPVTLASPVLQMTKLVYEVAEEDVIRARNQLKASILFSMDGSGGESRCYGLSAVSSPVSAHDRHMSQAAYGHYVA